MSRPILQVSNLRKHYSLPGGFFGRPKIVRAVDDLSFEIAPGETLALVGESGCGKSTVGKSVLCLFDITSGQILLDGRRIDDLSDGSLRPLRRRMQVVFQDPFSSLNPRLSVREAIAEPLRNFGLVASRAEMDRKVAEILDRVRLPHDAAKRLPHEFSGGQRQRIGIARALAPNPDLIVCDEAVSALDVSVKAQIVNLLKDLQADIGLALLFISHDLAVVENISHRIAVMYLGKIVEMAPKRRLFEAPRHPYTQALLSAVPIPEPGARRERILLRGDLPSPISPPSGCRFHTRCPYAFDRCRTEEPELRNVGSAHLAACHLAAPPQRVSSGTPPSRPSSEHASSRATQPNPPDSEPCDL